MMADLVSTKIYGKLDVAEEVKLFSDLNVNGRIYENGKKVAIILVQSDEPSGDDGDLWIDTS